MHSPYNNIVSPREINLAQKFLFFRSIYDLGLNIVPISQQAAKHPLVKWKHLQATRLDRETFEGYLRQFPLNDHWIVCGAYLTEVGEPFNEFGIVVVDADDAEAIAEAERRCPYTPVQATTRKGRHFVFRHPRSQRIKTKAKLLLDGRLLNIDIRADGGGVVAPGSTNKTWVTPWTHDLLMAAPIYDPAWLPYENCSPECEPFDYDPAEADDDIEYSMEERKQAARAWLSEQEPCQQGKGSGGASGYFLALCHAAYHDFALDRETTIDVMYWWGQQDEKQLYNDGSTGYRWTLDEVRHKVDDAVARPPEKPRGWRLWEYVQRVYERELDLSYHQITLEDGGESLAEGEHVEEHQAENTAPPLAELSVPATIASVDDWPEPQELRPDFVAVPPFPIAALRSACPVVAEVCETLAHHFQVPVDLPATLALAMMSIPLAGKVVAEISPNQFYHLMLWAFCAMSSGERKSPVLELLLAPFVAWEQEQRAKLARDVSRDQTERQIKRRIIKSLRQDLQAITEKELDDPAGYANATSDKATVIAKIERLEEALAVAPKHVPRLFTSDATPEAAAMLAATNDGVVNVIDDEGVFLANMAGRYANSPNYDVCLNGYTGSGYTVDRIKRGTVHIPHVYMVLGITAQPTILQSLVNNPIAREVGFLPRFLISYPESLLGKRLFTAREQMPTAPFTAWAQLVADLFLHKQCIVPRQLRQHPSNWDRLEALHAKYEPQVGFNGSSAHISTWLNKAVLGHGQITKLAGVLHCASGNEENVIQPETFEAAVTIIEYFAGHARKVYGMDMSDKAVETANKMLAIIRTKGLREFTPSYFDRIINALKKDRELRDASLEVLTRYAYVKPLSVRTRQNKEILHYCVNPLLSV